MNTLSFARPALRLAAATALLAAVCLPPAQAQSSGYFGGQISRISYKETGLDTFRPSALGLTLGKTINSNLDLELRVGTGLSDGSQTYSEYDYTYGWIPFELSTHVDSYVGGYARIKLPLGEQLTPYLLAGMTRATMTVKGQVFGATYAEAEASETDASLGLGLLVHLNEKVDLQLEWARLLKGSNYHADGLTAGLQLRF